MGSHTAQLFARSGWDVIAFDNLSRAKMLGAREGPIPETYNWDLLARADRVTRSLGDVRRLEELKPVVDRADAIVHTAAQVAVTTSLKDPHTDFAVNLLGTFNVLEAARASSKDPKILFCSTNKVYGDNVNRIPVRDDGSRYAYADKTFTNGIPTDFPIDGCEHTPYGVSKLAADLYVQDYARTYGMKTAIFRMSCIYGEGQSGNEDQGWVAHFVISILRGEPLTIYGDGKQVRDVLHVEDLCRGFDAALRSPRALAGGVFNVGGGPKNTLSLRELIEHMKRLAGREPVLSYADWRAGDQKVYISDVSRAAEVLNWTPRIPPEEGVERLARWFQESFLAREGGNPAHVSGDPRV